MKTLTAGAVSTEPVKVSAEEFQKAIQRLVREARPSELPRETARLLLEEPLQADLLMEVEAGRVVRMVPLEENTPLSASSNAALVSWYPRVMGDNTARLVLLVLMAAVGGGAARLSQRWRKRCFG